MWLLLYYLRSRGFFIIVFKGYDKLFLLAFICTFLDNLWNSVIPKPFYVFALFGTFAFDSRMLPGRILGVYFNYNS